MWRYCASSGTYSHLRIGPKTVKKYQPRFSACQRSADPLSLSLSPNSTQVLSQKHCPLENPQTPTHELGLGLGPGMTLGSTGPTRGIPQSRMNDSTVFWFWPAFERRKEPKKKKKKGRSEGGRK